MRIVALLVALADLAVVASRLSGHRRRRDVLKILGHGEAEARAFVLGMATGAPAPADAPGVVGDAAHLAASFRALALALCVLLARTGQSASSGPTGPRTGRRKPAGRVGRRAAASAPDTS
jgi:hypothetical protein